MKDRKSILDDADAKAKFPVPLSSKFIDETGAEQDFIKCDVLTRLGNALIEGRDCFTDLSEARIIFLWKREGGKSKGKLVLGRCQKPSGLLAYFSDVDFIIWLAADHCRDHAFTYLQVEATTFHELKHADVESDENDEIKFSINPHDWEGFADEYRIYGAWKSDIELIEKAFQPTLFDNLVSDAKTINHLREGEVKKSVTVDKDTVTQIDSKRTKTRTALPQV